MKCSEPIRASSYTIALRSQKGPGGQVHLKAELRRIPLPRTRMNKGKKRKGRNPLGPRPRFRGLAIPRIGYFRLATLLRLGQLVLDSVFDPPEPACSSSSGAASLRSSLLRLPRPAASSSSSRTLSLPPRSPFDGRHVRSYSMLPRIAPLSGHHVLFGTYNSERCLRASGVSNSW
jgi:hypothetical protein